MNVSDLRNLVGAAEQFAVAAGVSQTTRQKLTSVAGALSSFDVMDVEAFAELVRQADEYRRTGILSQPTTKQKRARKPPVDVPMSPKVEQLVKQLSDLFAIVHEESVGFGAIDEICEVVESLKAPEAKQVALGFGIKVNSRASKKAAMDAIREKLVQQKGSAIRNRPIDRPHDIGRMTANDREFQPQ